MINDWLLRLQHKQPLEFGSKPRCVFWNFQTSKWSGDGCWVDQSTSTRHITTCSCNHLTNFAVLMDVSGREKPSQAKSVLTILFTVISIISLVLTILCFSICRELKNRRTTILINLCVVLIIVDLLVLFGLDQTKHEVRHSYLSLSENSYFSWQFICKTVSILLLYFLLATFSWMLMEGYHLYQMIILVFSNIGHLRMLYLYLIGYGAPLIIAVAGSIWIGVKNGLTNEY